MSGPKFETHKYWKRKGVCCEFIEVTKVLSDDGIRASLIINICEQTDAGWMAIANDFGVAITKRDYLNWNQYVPRKSRIE